MKKVLVVDAHGGGVGKQIILALKKNFPDLEITAIGTNSTATSNMLKAGADIVATGENAIKVACKSTDLIIGPLGIVITDSLTGEITPKIAKAIGKSKAQRILFPFNNCNNQVLGVKNLNLSDLIQELLDFLKDLYV